MLHILTKTSLFKLCFVILLFFTTILSPHNAHAYFTTDQKAISITEQTALYMITYKFGHEDENFYMPILATRDLAQGSQSNSGGYEILEDGKTVTTSGYATGIILSNATVVDDMYMTQKGTLTSFTLLVIYTIPKSDKETNYTLHMQELPFYVGEERQARKLNPSELQYYVTPETSLNSN